MGGFSGRCHGALAANPNAAGIRKQLSLTRLAAESAIRRRLQLAVAQRQFPKSTDSALLARYFTTILWGLSVQAATGATRKQLEQTAAFALRALPTTY